MNQERRGNTFIRFCWDNGVNLATLATFIFTAGTVYHRLQTLEDSQTKQDERITTVSKSLTNALTAVAVLQAQVQLCYCPNGNGSAKH